MKLAVGGSPVSGEGGAKIYEWQPGFLCLGKREAMADKVLSESLSFRLRGLHNL